MKKALLLILIFSVINVHSSLSQQYFTRNYTINNGLPDNCIHELFKDSRGFLWIGTNAGLARFDGENFLIYSSQDGLGGDEIRSIVEDNEGNIWIGCHNGGISKLNGEEIVSFNSESGIVSNDVNKLYNSEKLNILLIGTENGLSIYENGKFTSFQEKVNNVDKRLSITGFLEQENFIYVFTNGHGLYKYVPDLRNLIRIPSNHPLNYNTVNSVFISRLNDTLINYNRTKLKIINNNKSGTNPNIGFVKEYAEDSDNNVWIAAWNNNYFKNGGLFKFGNNKTEKFNKFLGINSENIFSLEFDDNENILWIGTKEDGLFLYIQTNYSYYQASDFNLNELNINDLFYDESGTLWIVTKENVIKKYADGSYKVIHFKAFQTSFNAYLKNSIKIKYSYLKDKSGSYEKYRNLIISGKYPFPNPYQKSNGNKSEILPPKSQYKPLKYDVFINKELNDLNSICQDQKGNIWIGSNVGIFKIRNNDKVEYYDLAGIYFSDFAFDSENKLHAVCWEELLVYYDIEGNSNYSVCNFYDNKNTGNISKIKINDNKLWFLSLNRGVYTYNKDGYFSAYDQKDATANSFNDICFDNLNNIIKGGNNGNIYINQFSEDTLKNKFIINAFNGLSGSSIKWLSCTDENILIAGTNAGLNIINLNDLYNRNIYSIRTIDKSNGFTDYAGVVSVLGHNNNLWIGSNKNLINIDLKKLYESNNKYFDFYIKSVEVNGSTLEFEKSNIVDFWTKIPVSAFKLPYNKNSVTFHFDIIRYLDHENIGFSYKLEGYNNDWSNETKDKKIVFQNLEPGNYRLRIKAFEKYYFESNQELSIAFEISSPIWLKWWFIVSLSLTFLFSIWLLMKIRIKSVKRKERQRTEIAERITEFEMKALRAQMNPHFIFNAINSIQNYMLDDDIDTALGYLSDFAKLIRLTLDNVSKKRITLEEELEYLKYYLSLEQMRFDKKFETEIVLPKDTDNLKVLIPSMIIQPYIENSIKHGFANINKGGKIKIEFNLSNDKILKCIIEDNGMGREKSREFNKNNKSQKSKGTFIIAERLALLNQTMQRKGYRTNTIDLYNEQKLPRGTRVEIFIPK
ncbi:MAG: histidine kinase [Bacteroidales bacterium]|nr:histidine kinase [Bacteroidales bacterium]